MRVLMSVAAFACLALVFSSGTNLAGDKKETKETFLKGKITCAKCDLGTASVCETVIVVKGKDKEKDITYWFDKKAHGEHHGAICSSPMNGTVTGTVKDEGKKKVVNVKKVEFEK